MGAQAHARPPRPTGEPGARLEEAGKVEEALATYDAALEVYPGYLPAIQGLARLTLRAGRDDARLGGWLEEIAMRSDDARWRSWALEHKTRRR